MDVHKYIYLTLRDTNVFQERFYNDQLEYIIIDEYNELVSRFNELQQERDKLLKAMSLMIKGRKV